MFGTQAQAPVLVAGCFSTLVVPTTSPLASRPLPSIWKVLHTSKTDSLHRPPYTPACVPCLTMKNYLIPPGHTAHTPAPHRLSPAWKLSSPHLDPDSSHCATYLCTTTQTLTSTCLKPDHILTLLSLRMGHFSLGAPSLPYMGPSTPYSRAFFLTYPP